MPKKVGTTNWRRKRKQDNLEKKEFRYYIFCEGKQTEPNYFEGFKRFIETDAIYKDSFPKKDFNGVEERAGHLNQKNPNLQYHAAWSNECIEIWFILHFVNYTSNNHRAEYIRFLNNKFQELGIGNYEKNMFDIFEILLQYGSPKLAIRYAKRIMKENNGKSSAMIAPGTKVYELVEELAKYLPEDIRINF